MGFSKTRIAIVQNITIQIVGIFNLISTVTKSLILNGYVWSRINVKIYVDIFMCLTHKYHLLLLFTYNTSRKLKIESARVYDCREIRSGGKSQKWSPIIKVFLFSNHLRSIQYPQKNCLELLFWYFSLTILNRISLYNSPYFQARFGIRFHSFFYYINPLNIIAKIYHIMNHFDMLATRF